MKFWWTAGNSESHTVKNVDKWKFPFFVWKNSWSYCTGTRDGKIKNILKNLKNKDYKANWGNWAKLLRRGTCEGFASPDQAHGVQTPEEVQFPRVFFCFFLFLHKTMASVGQQKDASLKKSKRGQQQSQQWWKPWPPSGRMSKKVVAFYDTVIEKSIKLLVEVYLREAPHMDIIEN